MAHPLRPIADRLHLPRRRVRRSAPSRAPGRARGPPGGGLSAVKRGRPRGLGAPSDVGGGRQDAGPRRGPGLGGAGRGRSLAVGPAHRTAGVVRRVPAAGDGRRCHGPRRVVGGRAGVRGGGRGHPPRPGDGPAGVAPEELLGALGKHVRRLWQAVRRVEGGTSPARAVQAAGVPWRAQAAWIPLVSRLSSSVVTRTLERLVETDTQLKTGAGTPLALLEPCVWGLAGLSEAAAGASWDNRRLRRAFFRDATLRWIIPFWLAMSSFFTSRRRASLALAGSRACRAVSNRLTNVFSSDETRRLRWWRTRSARIRLAAD